MSIVDQLLHIYPDLDFEVGCVLRQELGGIYIAEWNDVRTQPTIVELNAAIIPAKRDKLKTDIDELTATKIAAIFNLPAKSTELIIKQLNASARVSDLQEIEINGVTLTAQELAEKQDIKSVWDRVKALRLAGKTKQIEVDTTYPDTYDLNIGWPE